MKTFLKPFVVLFAAMAVASIAQAHNINYALEDAPTQNIIGYYLNLGFIHIIPEGLDHILFIIGLCLLNTKLKTIFWQATAFTVAHTITLAMSMKNIIVAPSEVIEPIIALSIAFIAIENLLLNELKPWRILLVFLFGLIHGLGFASVLNEIGLPPDAFYLSVISFNAGVEVGQITVIALIFLLIIYPFKRHRNFKKIVVYPLSILIAAISLYWTVERVFFT